MRNVFILGILILFISSACQQNEMKIIGMRRGCDLNYLTDGESVFLENEKIVEADPASFQVIGDGFFSKDKNNVYRVGRFKYCQDSAFKILDVEPEAFKALSGAYFIYKNQIYYARVGSDNLLVKDADLKSFVVVGYDYAKDQRQVYYAEKVSDADPKTFKLPY